MSYRTLDIGCKRQPVFVLAAYTIHCHCDRHKHWLHCDRNVLTHLLLPFFWLPFLWWCRWPIFFFSTLLSFFFTLLLFKLFSSFIFRTAFCFFVFNFRCFLWWLQIDSSIGSPVWVITWVVTKNIYENLSNYGEVRITAISL